MTRAKILAALLRLPQSFLDHDTPEERIELLTPVSESIFLEARNDEEAAALIAHSWNETKNARLVLTGHCDQMPKGQQCDGGKARGPFQVHRWCTDAWEVPDGTLESYRAGAHCVLKTLRFGYAHCHTWEGAFAGLRGQAVCDWDRSEAYAKVQKQVLVWWRTGVV
jgi:hypothetical protein